jgi:hypothetical protein
MESIVRDGADFVAVLPDVGPSQVGLRLTVSGL